MFAWTSDDWSLIVLLDVDGYTAHCLRTNACYLYRRRAFDVRLDIKRLKFDSTARFGWLHRTLSPEQCVLSVSLEARCWSKLDGATDESGAKHPPLEGERWNGFVNAYESTKRKQTNFSMAICIS